jgi:hypothetical protein
MKTMEIQNRRSIAAMQVNRTLVAGLFLALATGSAHAAIPDTERADLDALYAQSGGSSWTISTGWEGAAGIECSWQGVSCDAGGDHVVAISLSDNNLSGTLAGIAGLSALQSFDVSSNNLAGSIPALTALAALQNFNASQNQLTGSIPSLSGLANLSTFDVGNNLLTGNVPDLSSTSMTIFLVQGNQLSGRAPIPPNPNTLTVAASSLCPNLLGPVSTPEAVNDLIWDNATDDDPWTEGGCSTAPVVPATAVPTPTLTPTSLLMLIGLFGIAGGILARYRAL